jgi:hypothetical protein
MSNYTYSLPLGGWLLSHKPGRALLLRDGDEPEDEQELRAFVRSGDYFAMLATRLDSISDNLDSTNAAEAAILQHYVDTLLYLDRKYKIIEK